MFNQPPRSKLSRQEMNVTIAKQATDNQHSSRVSGIEKKSNDGKVLLLNCLLPVIDHLKDCRYSFAFCPKGVCGASLMTCLNELLALSLSWIFKYVSPR
jgi:hypothetical protein